jgi:hypothetical protein
MKKQEKLLGLMAEIQIKNFLDGEEAWFFPKHKESGVKGFLGTEKVAFVGKNPSFGHFPSDGNLFLYKELSRAGFKNAHITDVIKRRLTNEEAKDIEKKKRILSENLKWLRLEIDILGSVKIVAMGRDVQKMLKKYFSKDAVSDKWLHHYSWVEKYSEGKRKEKRKAFRKRLGEIKKEVLSFRRA